MPTWRRQGRVLGPMVRDIFGAEVSYARALQGAGAVPFMLPQPQSSVTAREVLDGFDGLLLIGGEDVAAEVSGAAPETIGENADADRDTWELALLRGALGSGVPVLAICRGMQLLNIAFGGTLSGHMTGQSVEHPVLPGDVSAALAFTHRVDLAPHSRLHAAVGKAALVTNSLHHQSVDRLGRGLTVTAVAADGVVEALEPAIDTWCVGVQWHPELMPEDSCQRSLLSAFVDTCRSRQQSGTGEESRRILTPTTGRAS